jgi:hypothetical protein
VNRQIGEKLVRAQDSFHNWSQDVIITLQCRRNDVTTRYKRLQAFGQFADVFKGAHIHLVNQVVVAMRNHVVLSIRLDTGKLRFLCH